MRGRGQAGLAPVSTRAEMVLSLDDAGLLEGLSVLHPALRTHLVQGGTSAVVDVSGLTRMSSGTLAALLLAKRRCRARGAELVVRGAGSGVADLLHRAGLSAEELSATSSGPGAGR